MKKNNQIYTIYSSFTAPYAAPLHQFSAFEQSFETFDFHVLSKRSSSKTMARIPKLTVILSLVCLSLLVYLAVVKTDPSKSLFNSYRLSRLNQQITKSELKISDLESELAASKKILNEMAYSRKRLGILSIHTPPYYKTWANWTIANRKKYSKKHGYGMYIENGKSDVREPVWSKIQALLRHMEDDRHDWFWVYIF